MSADETALKRIIQEAAAQQRQQDHEHPSPDDLFAYQERSLPEDEAEAIRGHLALCAECADLVLDLEDFPHLAAREGEAELSAAEHREDLQALLAALPGAATKPAPAPRRSWLPLAAAITAAVLGVSLWLAGVPSPVVPGAGGGDSAVGPVNTFDLYPEGQGRGGGIVVLADPVYPDNPTVLSFNTLGLDPARLYRLEARQGDQQVFVRTQLRPDANGVLTLLAPPAWASSGEVRVVLQSMDAAADAAPIAEYRFQVPPR